jgi:hypothetical protein
MAHEIRPLTPGDLPELSRFLTEGFGTPAGAAFAAPEVLRWKYFDPRGDDAGDAPRSYVVSPEGVDRIVGHVGVCPGRFRGIGLPAEGVSTLHMIDWLTSGEGRGAGATLLRRMNRAAETHYGFGGSAAARVLGSPTGFRLVAMVPAYQRVLRAGYRLKVPGPGLPGRLLRAAKDAAGMLTRRPRRPRAAVELRQVEAFGPEVELVLAAYQARAVFTSRGPGLLNSFLRYPRGGVTGWHVLLGGALRGFAVLSVVPQEGGARAGRVADCLLDDPDDAAWHAAIVALTAALKGQGADVAVGFASTDWMARALRASGYAPSHALEFRIHDRAGRLPRDAPFHLTHLEADYAYT